MGVRKRVANSSCVSLSARRITLTCGTRFRCFSRSGVRGGLSGSVSAAALNSSSVIFPSPAQSVSSGGKGRVVPSGRTSTKVPSFSRLATIVRPLLVIVGLSRGDDANAFAALGLDHVYQSAFDLNDGHNAVLDIVH